MVDIVDIPSYADIPIFYGKPNKNLVLVYPAYEMELSWNKKVKINSFLAHKKIKSNLEEIFKEVLLSYGEEKIKELGLNQFGGCYNNRKIRGGQKLSTHAWGIAIDIDSSNNRHKWGKDKARLARPEYKKFWEIVYRHGGLSMGIEKGYDYMHIQFASIK